jgi:hypothetical protein
MCGSLDQIPGAMCMTWDALARMVGGPGFLRAIHPG